MSGTQITMDSDLFDGAVKIAAAGGGAGGGFVFVRWAINWLTGRHDLREAQLETKDAAIDARWAAYTKKMEERCSKLEERCERFEGEIETCHSQKRELESRIVKLEAHADARGEMRQAAQVRDSLDRTISTRVKKGDGE